MKTLLATLALCATATAAAQDIALLNIRQKEVGHIRQIATDDALGIAAVNDKGELWQWHDSAWHKLADGFAAHTPLSAGHGRITGAFNGENCRGPEKVARLQAMFGEDVRLAAAYGDTSGDTEMLQIAEEKGYRVFNGRPN